MLDKAGANVDGLVADASRVETFESKDRHAAPPGRQSGSPSCNDVDGSTLRIESQDGNGGVAVSLVELEASACLPRDLGCPNPIKRLSRHPRRRKPYPRHGIEPARQKVKRSRELSGRKSHAGARLLRLGRGRDITSGVNRRLAGEGPAGSRSRRGRPLIC